MNTIFFTQSSGLGMFFDLMQTMRRITPLENVGFYVTNSDFFKKFKKDHPDIESVSYSLLKEWDIVRDSKSVKPDIELLRRYERKIGNPFLWNALVGDRRIYFGKKYAYAQDYRPRFSHERMLAILQVALKQIEAFFDRVQPAFVVSFQCVTIGEYLSYLFARSRNIPVLNLRPTRIQNYFYASEDIFEPSEHLKETYEQLLQIGIDASLMDEAMRYLQKVRESHAMYEGVVPPSNKPPAFANAKRRRLELSKLKKIISILVREFRYRFGEYQDDNHISGHIGPAVNQYIIRPWRAKRLERCFGKIYVRVGDLKLLNYAFFPLHTEPEVTLSVYSKAYVNQIEAVRLVSHNLPVGMKLVVKEHPWSIGKRPLSYYHKLLKIPNVMLAHPSLNSRELVSQSQLITVIAGSIAFEGLMLGKPVITLGRTPFNFLPCSMIRHIDNPNLLGDEIRELLENYEYNEEALVCYIAGVMKNSVQVDFYSRLLGRKETYREEAPQTSISEETIRMEHIERLAKYLVERYNAFTAIVLNTHNGG